MALVTSSNGDIPIELGDRPGADTTACLLLALTALYVQRPTHTGEEQQQYIELALRLIDKVDAATRTAVGSVLQRHPEAPAELVERLGGSQLRRDGDPQGEPRSTQDQHCAGNEHERIYGRVCAAALHGRVSEFTHEFRQLIDIPQNLCERILNDPTGGPMVVAAKAAGMPIGILQRLLLLAGPGVSHSVQRVYELTELYHGLDANVAHGLLAKWRARAEPDDPIPEPDTEDSRPDVRRNPSVATLRSRFGALSARVRRQAFNAQRDQENVARRGLRSR